MLDEHSMTFMKDLMEAFGPSGFEREPARIFKGYVEAFGDDILTDKLGSLVAVGKGSRDRPHVLLAGHMDEVGFVISGIDKDTGYLTFNTLGGWWDQVLLGQRVTVRTNKGDLIGVIAAKPPHLLKEEEKKEVLTKDNMYIDIGATASEEAEDTGVRVGDPVTPWSPFSTILDGRVAMGKAFDDRIGTFVAAETLRRLKEQNVDHPNTVYAAATVQEEVGLRGARTVSHMVDPDAGVALEVGIAGDVPGIKPYEAQSKMGKGPSLTTYDSSMIPNQPFKELVIRTAEDIHVPLQLAQSARGGTDAGRIHLNRAGCPSIVLGIPTRHIHSHVGLLSLQDVENAVKLTVELVRRLNSDTISSFTAL